MSTEKLVECPTMTIIDYINLRDTEYTQWLKERAILIVQEIQDHCGFNIQYRDV